MSAREDRLAKIMSMASGRTVDPKEVHVDRTPSPSFSERAAAGVGDVIKPQPPGTDLAGEASAMSRSRMPACRRSVRCLRICHILSIVVTSIIFCGWYYLVFVREVGSLQSLALGEPWQLLFALFCGVEGLEWYSGRLTNPLDIPRDAALYLFSLLLFLKLFA